MSLAFQGRQLSVPPLVVVVLRTGYHIPFSSPAPLSPVPIPMPCYFPSSIKGKVLRGEVLSFLEKGAVKLAPLSSGYYSQHGLHWNHVVIQTRFRMETNQSVLRLIRRYDWMVSTDLKDTYIQNLVHHESRQFFFFFFFCGSWCPIPVQGSVL